MARGLADGDEVLEKIWGEGVDISGLCWRWAGSWGRDTVFCYGFDFHVTITLSSVCASKSDKIVARITVYKSVLTIP